MEANLNMPVMLSIKVTSYQLFFPEFFLVFLEATAGLYAAVYFLRLHLHFLSPKLALAGHHQVQSKTLTIGMFYDFMLNKTVITLTQG